MGEPLVDIHGASVARHGPLVLRDITLHVHRGEFVGIIGPNGAGKTTLLMMINALLAPAHGQVDILGVRLPTWRGYRIRRRIGYVAQVESVDPRLPMTVRETVQLGAAGRLGWFHRLGREEARKADEALNQTGLTRLAQRPIGQLSGGEYQRTAIARALVQSPELFLFDEPTASVDPRAQRDILHIIQEMHLDRGATALYVTHDLHTLPERCTRLVLMKEGRVWRDGPKEEMLAPALLRELYERAGGGSSNGGPGEP
ncbi:MAG TPA: ATP-binding cassette domain-containing protein [Candidatus Hydrogenedentes bacterium]|nr:ATP-binding cassette domain-containing protein [Candidatus Hydrogenedentota bacterium]